MRKQEHGSILVMTVMTVAVLMLVGVAFLSLASSEYLANASHADRLQAFYEAEAGLAFGKKYVSDNTALFDFNSNQVYIIPLQPELPPLIEESRPLIELKKSGEEWELISTSTIRRAKQTVRLSVVPAAQAGSQVQPPGGGPPIDPPDEALFLGKPSFNEHGNPTYTVNGTTYVPEIGKSGNMTVLVQTGGYVDIFVKTFDMQGSNELVISGGGTVRLFVKDSFDYQSDAPEINKAGPDTKLLVYPWNANTELLKGSENGAKRKYTVLAGQYAESFSALSQDVSFPRWGGN